MIRLYTGISVSFHQIPSANIPSLTRGLPPRLPQLYATGYGAGGRLGIGGTESVSTPTLLESIQHVFIRKVAVNSGGKHCLALSSEGEVYSWGEAEDGKLGHGNRR